MRTHTVICVLTTLAALGVSAGDADASAALISAFRDIDLSASLGAVDTSGHMSAAKMLLDAASAASTAEESGLGGGWTVRVWAVRAVHAAEAPVDEVAAVAREVLASGEARQAFEYSIWAALESGERAPPAVVGEEAPCEPIAEACVAVARIARAPPAFWFANFTSPAEFRIDVVGFFRGAPAPRASSSAA